MNFGNWVFGSPDRMAIVGFSVSADNVRGPGVYIRLVTV